MCSVPDPQATQDALFWDREAGGYYGTADPATAPPGAADPSIRIRIKVGLGNACWVGWGSQWGDGDGVPGRGKGGAGWRGKGASGRRGKGGEGVQQLVEGTLTWG